MKTKIGNYYIFFNEKDFKTIYSKYILRGYSWVHGGNKFPFIVSNDYPIVLNCDKEAKNMIYGIVAKHKNLYFLDENFVKLYNSEIDKIRIKKINRILNEK